MPAFVIHVVFVDWLRGGLLAFRRFLSSMKLNAVVCTSEPFFCEQSSPLVQVHANGIIRIDGLAPDIGAYESQVSTFVVSLLNDEQDGNISQDEMSLREAVAVANLNPGPDEITFIQVGDHSLIALSHGEITISDSVKINGSLGPRWLAIIQNSSGRVFRIESPDADIEVDLVRVIVTGHAGAVSGTQEGGAIRSTELLRLDEATVRYSRAARGGGIYQTDAPLFVKNSSFRDNWAMKGAGIYLTSSATLHIQGTLFRSNQARTAHGGAIWSEGATEIYDSIFADNAAVGNGGAIHSAGTLSVANTSFVENQALSGGALSLVGDSITIVQSTFSANTGELDGGAIRVSGDTAAVDIKLSTIYENHAGTEYSAGQGGGIYSSEVGVLLRDSIVAANVRGPSRAPSDLYLNDVSGVMYSLIGHNAGSSLAESRREINGNIIGGDANGAVDPELAPRGEGWDRWIHVPTFLSPVHDGGTPDRKDLPELDQIGQPRLVGGRVDMGAIEIPKRTIDFNYDLEFDCEDIDALTVAIVSPEYVERFDINDNGKVDFADGREWLKLAGAEYLGGQQQYLRADANLDGVVDFIDLAIWDFHKFTEQPAFCSGDFNFDGIVDNADFNIWNIFKFSPSGLLPTSHTVVVGNANISSRQLVVMDGSSSPDGEATRIPVPMPAVPRSRPIPDPGIAARRFNQSTYKHAESEVVWHALIDATLASEWLSSVASAFFS